METLNTTTIRTHLNNVEALLDFHDLKTRLGQQGFRNGEQVLKMLIDACRTSLDQAFDSLELIEQGG